jgi:hypothetical protein
MFVNITKGKSQFYKQNLCFCYYLKREKHVQFTSIAKNMSMNNLCLKPKINSLIPLNSSHLLVSTKIGSKFLIMKFFALRVWVLRKGESETEIRNTLLASDYIDWIPVVFMGFKIGLLSSYRINLFLNLSLKYSY